MASDKQPTNEHIAKQLEAISHQLSELREAQKQIANNLKVIAKAGH